MPPRKKKANIVTSLIEVSKYFDVAYNTVRQSWRHRNMPVEPDGTYDLDKISKWYEEWRSLRNSNQHTGNGEDLGHDIVRRRKELDNAIKAEDLKEKQRKNEIAEGDYVLRESVDRFFAGVYTWLRDDLDRIPLEMKPSFPKAVQNDLVNQLRSRLHLTLVTLSRQQKKIAEIARSD